MYPYIESVFGKKKVDITKKYVMHLKCKISSNKMPHYFIYNLLLMGAFFD